MNGHLGILVQQWPSDIFNNVRDRFKADVLKLGVIPQSEKAYKCEEIRLLCTRCLPPWICKYLMGQFFSK